ATWKASRPSSRSRARLHLGRAALGVGRLFLGLAFLGSLAEAREVDAAQVQLRLGKGGRVGEVLIGRKQVGVAPNRVAAVDPAVLGQRRPQSRRFAQPPRT